MIAVLFLISFVCESFIEFTKTPPVTTRKTVTIDPRRLEDGYLAALF